MKTLTRKTVAGKALEEVWGRVATALAAASRGALAAGDVVLAPAPEHTGNDLAFKCFALAPHWKTSPNKIASEIAASLEADELISVFEADGGYLNIRLDRAAVTRRVLRDVEAGASRQRRAGGAMPYGHSRRQQDEVVMMEYISPNTNKPLHLGHIRNGLLGRSVANLIAAQGAAVYRTDIINDRGIHIAKSMIAYQRWGDGATPESTGAKGDHFVGEYYVRFDQELRRERAAWLESQDVDTASLNPKQEKDLEARFNAESELMAATRELLKAWEAGATEARELWQRMNGWVYEGFDATYRELGIDFDQHYHESEIYQRGREIIHDAVEKGIFEQRDDGAIIAPLAKSFDKLNDKVVLRADGTGVYITQDINLASIKFDQYRLTRSLYCIATEQDYYMKQLFATLKLLGFPWADGLVHLSYGMVRLPEGKMKSREGTVVDADDLIVEMRDLAREALRERHADLDEADLENRARAIGLSAMTFHFLIVGKDTEMLFDPRKSLAFEGKTGPYLQYSYARASSILRKAGGWQTPESPATGTDVEWRIWFGIMLFPSVVADAAECYDPSRLANHLVELAQGFSSFYRDHKVLSAEEPVRAGRLALVRSYRAVIGNGLRLLGIEPLEEM